MVTCPRVDIYRLRSLADRSAWALEVAIGTLRDVRIVLVRDHHEEQRYLRAKVDAAIRLLETGEGLDDYVAEQLAIRREILGR